MPKKYILITGSSAPVLTTIDPVYHSTTGWSFSGGNLIVNGTTVVFGQQRSTVSHSIGKWYFEVKFTTISSTNCVVGIIGSTDTNGNWPGKTATSYGILAGSTIASQGRNNSVVYPVAGVWSATFTTGDIIGFAIDLTGLTLSVYKNGTLITPSGNAISSGTYYAALGVINSGGAVQFNANFGQTAYAIPGGLSPTGYSNW